MNSRSSYLPACAFYIDCYHICYVIKLGLHKKIAGKLEIWEHGWYDKIKIIMNKNTPDWVESFMA